MPTEFSNMNMVALSRYHRKARASTISCLRLPALVLILLHMAACTDLPDPTVHAVEIDVSGSASNEANDRETLTEKITESAADFVENPSETHGQEGERTNVVVEQLAEQRIGRVEEENGDDPVPLQIGVENGEASDRVEVLDAKAEANDAAQETSSDENSEFASTSQAQASAAQAIDHSTSQNSHADNNNSDSLDENDIALEELTNNDDASPEEVQLSEPEAKVSEPEAKVGIVAGEHEVLQSQEGNASGESGENVSGGALDEADTKDVTQEDRNGSTAPDPDHVVAENNDDSHAESIAGNESVTEEASNINQVDDRDEAASNEQKLDSSEDLARETIAVDEVSSSKEDESSEAAPVEDVEHGNEESNDEIPNKTGSPDGQESEDPADQLQPIEQDTENETTSTIAEEAIEEGKAATEADLPQGSAPTGGSTGKTTVDTVNSSTSENTMIDVEVDRDFPKPYCGVWGKFRWEHKYADLPVLFLLFQDLFINEKDPGAMFELRSNTSELLDAADKVIYNATASLEKLQQIEHQSAAAAEAAMSDTTTSATTKRAKSVNAEFVEGLDDIGKFFEGVEPPDELDVGASGSSIQEVLVGQGTRIVLKRIKMGLIFVRKVVDKTVRSITQHFEDEDVNFISKDDVVRAAKWTWELSKELFHKTQELLDRLFEGGDLQDDYDEEFGFLPKTVPSASSRYQEDEYGTDDDELQELLLQQMRGANPNR